MLDESTAIGLSASIALRMQQLACGANEKGPRGPTMLQVFLSFSVVSFFCISIRINVALFVLKVLFAYQAGHICSGLFYKSSLQIFLAGLSLPGPRKLFVTRA